MEKRVLLGIVGGVLLVDLGLYSFVLYPLGYQVEEARSRALNAGESLEKSKRTLDAAQSTTEQQVLANTKLREFYDGVLPQDLASARAMMYSRLFTLARSTNLVVERRSSSAEEIRDAGMNRLRTTLVVAGEYRDIRQFIFNLESSMEFIVIDEVVLSQAQEEDVGLVLALAVSSYYPLRRTS